jgi:hypothetical protein
MIKITLICTYCKKEFKRAKAQVNENKKRGRQNFCSPACIQNSLRLPAIKCLQCNKQFFPGVSDRKFCSQRCSATYSNIHRVKSGIHPDIFKEYIKGIPQIKCTLCKICAKPLEQKRHNNGKFSRVMYCETCKPRKSITTKTKEQLFKERKTWQSARSSIRKNAERIYLSAFPKPTCVICGYSTTVEVAHRRAVSSFSGSAPITAINNISNLIGLCPNHHYEFDKGLIILP